jgi:starch synthase
MRICLVASEVAPFAKTGGLGDVVGALGRYLSKHGHDVRVFLPLYPRVRDAGVPLQGVGYLRDVTTRMGRRSFTWSAETARLPGSACDVYFVDCPPLYARKGVYAQDGDEHLRFGLLSRAALDACQRMGFAPHVVHCNDWHTAMIPLWLRTVYAWDRLFERTRTVLTIHNLAYQGGFPSEILPDLGLEGFEGLLHQDELRRGRVGYLVCGILYADAITAVSETYAREIRTEEHGFGLDAMLRARADHVFGIVNGVDVDVWSPEHDPHLPARYSARDLSGKAVCRRRLLDATGLRPEPAGPVFGVVSRLTSQKGFDLFPDVLPRILATEDVRLVALGSGSSEIAAMLRNLARSFPGKVHFQEGYDEPFAHRIEAGIDAFLMPSLFEPCGLNQMYSLRYGSPPVVRRTGGLADTVRNYDPATGRGTGIVFDHYSAAGFRWAVETAIRLFRDRGAWRRMQLEGMAEDVSWDRRIEEYVSLYRRLSGAA